MNKPAGDPIDKPIRKFYTSPLKMNLRTKTILIISLTSMLLLAVVINSLFINVANITTNFSAINQPPSFEHIFGTDWMGRDMFTRTMKGLGLSIMIGAFASIISMIIAVILGLMSSMNKYLDTFVSWLVDLFSSIPHLLLIILVSISLGGGAVGVIIGVGVSHWTSLTRVLRAEVKQINTSDYVHISKNFGKSKWWIAKYHILPLVLTQIFLGVILVFPHAIMHEASVTFLGFGLSPHEPAIGVILAESMKYLATGAWWLAFFPGISLLIIVLSFDLVGDNLQRLLDPTNAHE
ncbi:MAG: ABC transporter permease [Methanobrevibacter arboriphilus]|jgi:peptide/nickel transport system permease protein|uniref:ABC transporter permease n=2 Tax=Methanobrevibacter arboriphilus TaxID=39441 RepID=A0ACA8R0L8_METAZ|nr:ABC transporter permease [Methanobrevibacter arboriphilus]MBF4469115.1 ABC transporter permease [Methanobrevibacter arboriphilus]BBL60965.1 ABC transporter permease [Methanobrevibacter arboriphilus]GLI12086.1 ABC transporter permease [Methanobrevibacter arboriphilus]